MSGSGAYCSLCYTVSIRRLCDGFTITKPGGRAAVAVPPLDPALAFSVRKAARDILASRGTGTANRHGDHIRKAAAA